MEMVPEKPNYCEFQEDLLNFPVYTHKGWEKLTTDDLLLLGTIANRIGKQDFTVLSVGRLMEFTGRGKQVIHDSLRRLKASGVLRVGSSPVKGGDRVLMVNRYSLVGHWHWELQDYTWRAYQTRHRHPVEPNEKAPEDWYKRPGYRAYYRIPLDLVGLPLIVKEKPCQLTGRDLVILGAIQEILRPNPTQKYVTLSYARLGELTGLGEWQIREGMLRLTQAKLIEVQKQEGLIRTADKNQQEQIRYVNMYALAKWHPKVWEYYYSRKQTRLNRALPKTYESSEPCRAEREPSPDSAPQGEAGSPEIKPQGGVCRLESGHNKDRVRTTPDDHGQHETVDRDRAAARSSCSLLPGVLVVPRDEAKGKPVLPNPKIVSVLAACGPGARRLGAGS